MKLNIDTLNWPKEWPVKPETTVYINRTDKYLILHYCIKNECVRAVATQDFEPVWEDSCVEFFCQIPGNKTYMNFETNCIGTMVASRRAGRCEDVVPFNEEQMATIERITTLPKGNAITTCDNMPTNWEVEIRIPWTLILNGQQPLFPLTLKANFYKCGDKTKRPHFVSWAPIETSKPDFHRPEFFKELIID